MVISQKVIGRMSPNLVWHSFSTDPSCVANYKEIRRGHVNFMLIWYGMTPLANGDEVSGNVSLSSSFKHISPAFSINSFAYSVKICKYVNTYNYMN